MNKYYLMNELGLNCGTTPVTANSYEEAFKKFKNQASGAGWKIACDNGDTAVDINLNAKCKKIFKNSAGEKIEY